MANFCEEESRLMGDSKYRSYVALTDKVLKAFENTSEWADLISTLSKLNKVLMSHSKFPVVPRRIIISKRLAQCMHPALPSGVHLKALETYDIIFKNIGTKRLGQELFIYSAGLFPLFVFAAMSVRSGLLTIYETHFVPLGLRLRPGLNGFLSGILPGLEEGSDHLERTERLLHLIAEGVGRAEFFGSLWECVAGNGSIRLPALSHITSCYNKKLSTEDQLYILGTNLDTMVSGLCNCLVSGTVLVQRAGLELALTALPLHNSRLLLPHDTVRLVSAALLTLLRRDTSLNRRLFSWLLGLEEESALAPDRPEHRTSARADSSYFAAFSRPLLTEGILCCFRESEGRVPADLRPYKLVLCLLDRPELGQDMLDSILLDMLRCLYHSCEAVKASSQQVQEGDVNTSYSAGWSGRAASSGDSSSSKHLSELNKSAGLVLGAVQPWYPWQQLLRLLHNCEEVRQQHKAGAASQSPVQNVGCGHTTFSELCTLMTHLLYSLPLDTPQQMEAAKLIDVLFVVTDFMTERVDVLSAMELNSGVNFCHKLLQKLMSTMAVAGPSNTDASSANSTLTNGQPELPSQLTIKVPAKDNLSREASSFSSEELSTTSRNALHESIDVTASRSLLSYAEVFEKFFLSFVLRRIFGEKFSLDSFRKALLEPKDRDSSSEVSNLLRECLACSEHKDTCVNSAAFCCHSLQGSISDETLNRSCGSSLGNVIQLNENFQQELPAFDFACVVLIDLSSIPISSDKAHHLSSLNGVRQDSNTVRISTDATTAVTSASSCSKTNISNDAEAVQRSSSSGDDLPAWFLGLLACSCSGPHCTALQHSALATLCELVMIGGSEVSVWRVLALQAHSAISIVPRLLPHHVGALQHRTLFYQEVTRLLWEQLQQPHKPSQVRSVELLLRLHSITSLAPQSAAARRNKVAAARSPTCPSLVERELLADLTRSSGSKMGRRRARHAGPEADTGQCTSVPSLEAPCDNAVQRWLALWQLSRHCGASAAARTATHTFDRCLFLMLEWLRTSHGSQNSCSSRQRAQAQQWLCEGLSSGDTARIIDPVLCLLLHPHTRRISVQHVTVTPLHNDQLHPMMGSKRASETAGDCSSDSLIYAISSEGGDVMYHVSKDDPNSAHSKKMFSPSAKQILALTTLMNNKLITENVQLPEYEVPYMGTNDEHHMSVLVNPFSRHPWLEMEDMSDMNKNVSAMTSESPDTEFEDATEASSTTGEDEAPSVRSQASGDSKSSATQVVETASNLVGKQSQGDAVTWSPQQIAESVVNEILERALEECAQTQPSESESGSMDSATDNPSPAYGSLKPSDMTLHPLHSHMLLYTQLVDSGQCLYGLTLLRNILESQPKLSLLSFASTGISALQSQSELMVLMARHKQCVLGHGFDSGDSSDIVGQYRSVMYLQAVITVCLYFIRSYYPQLPHLRLEDEHLQDNMEVQVVAVEILELIFTNLSSLVLESPRGLAPYVLDLLNKCKVQKCVLYCLLATVHAMRLPSNAINNRTNRALEAKTFTQELLDYNYRRNGERSPSAHETYLLNVMNLTVSLIKLEDALSSTKIDNSIPRKDSITSKSHSFAHYQPGLTIPAQPMFLRVVFSALGQKHTRHLHTAWLRLFTSTLPYMNNALPKNALRTSSFLCTMLEELPKYYENTLPSSLRPVPPDYTLTLLSSLTTIVHFCVLDQSSPTMICGAPYLGSSSKPSMSSGSTGNNAAPNSNGASQMFFNILNVFTPVADALEDSLDSADQDPASAARKALLSHLPRLVAVLLPLWHVTSSDDELSESSDIAKQYYGMETQCMAGTKSAVVQQIVAFLSPICHHHAPDFIVAISLVWQSLSETEVCKAASGSQSPTTSVEPDAAVLSKSASCQSLSQLHSDAEDRSARSLTLPKKHFLKNPPCSNSLQDVNKGMLDSQLPSNQRRGSHPMNLDSLHDAPGIETATRAIDLQLPGAEDGEAGSGSLKEQLLAVHKDRRALVGMVAAVRVLPLHLFLDTVKQVLRQPPTLHRSPQSVEVSVLEVLHCYTCSSSADQLGASWKPLVSLLKEAVLALQPEALLLLLPILNNFVQRAPPILEKRQFKELQEVAGRLVESISNIAGSSLEATAWLRRNLAVKSRQDQSHAWRVSVLALEALAAEVASLLDVLYSSDEKDKVLPFLTQLMTHVTPYLRDHTVSNQRPFLACSRLVAALSGYQYTLKAWRKDVLELLLDTNAFRMTSASLTYWKTIVDNLFTHDKSIFKEIIGRVSLSQGGSLHLFTSKEAEYASRASLLKRFAFTIFCSEPDQYNKFFPDIQERVTEVSRLGEMVPVLVGAVLGVVAVLVVRMAPRAMVSLWPVIITEMVQVFQVMEQQLLRQNYASNQQGKRQGGQDGRNNNNSQSTQPSLLSLFLAACKLLDLLLALPAHSLPQFQMYRWAFVGSGESGCSSNGDVAVSGAAPADAASSDFVPHVRRIARLMALRKQADKNGAEERHSPVCLDLTPGHMLLGGVSSISSLLDLEPFFHRLTNYSSPLLLQTRSAAVPAIASQNLHNIEKQLERSFIEPLLENP